MANNLFAPPSSDEISATHSDLFAPPHPAELGSVGVKLPKEYEEPIGPEQSGAMDRFVERVKDPERLKALVGMDSPYSTHNRMDVVEGEAPLVMPGGAVPKLAKMATALSEGQGLGYALGRTALSGGQAFTQSALSGPSDQSIGDRLERAKSGGKLSAAIQLGAESIPYVGKALGYASRKAGQALSGVSEDMIQHYANKTDEVNNLIKSTGGDMTQAADQVRSELSSGVQKAKGELNSQISGALENSHKDAIVDVAPIVEKLKAAREKLNPNFKASAISDLDEIIKNIEAEAQAGGGKVTPQSLYQIKQYLNEASSSAYNKGGQIFTRASEAARAAKEAAHTAREAVKTHIPEIAQADSQLSRLHTIERSLNKNLLKAGAPDSALVAAGSGGNKRNEAALQLLGDVAGVDAVGKAKNLAAAKTFANPSIMPTDYTGKAAARILLSGGIGGAIAGPAGAAVGGAIASPMAVKVGINSLDVAKKIASRMPQFGEMTRKNPVAAHAIVQLIANRLRDENRTSDIPPELQDAPKLMQDEPENRSQKVRRAISSKRSHK